MILLQYYESNIRHLQSTLRLGAYDLFSSVGEKVVIIEDDFDKTLAKLLD